MATKSPYKEIEDDGINIHCVVCGSQIHAGSYPPVCTGTNSNCRLEWDIEIEFNKAINRSCPTN